MTWGRRKKSSPTTLTSQANQAKAATGVAKPSDKKSELDAINALIRKDQESPTSLIERRKSQDKLPMKKEEEALSPSGYTDKSEADEINRLIKQVTQSEGDRAAPLRERRKSMSRDHFPVPSQAASPSTPQDAPEMTRTIGNGTGDKHRQKRRAVSEDFANLRIETGDGGQPRNVLRDRRKSLSSETGSADKPADGLLVQLGLINPEEQKKTELQMINDLIRQDTIATKSRQPTKELKHAFPVDPSPESVQTPATTKDRAKTNWRDGLMAVKVARKLHGDDWQDKIVDEPVSVHDHLERLLRPTVSHSLSGAAGRGARAAALGRVRAASAACGGLFLTREEYDAMKGELAMLRIANKRMEKEMVELRKQNAEVA